MFDYDNLGYSFINMKQIELNLVFFLFKKFAAVTSTSIPISVNSKLGTTPKYYLRPPKFDLTARRIITLIFIEI